MTSGKTSSSRGPLPEEYRYHLCVPHVDWCVCVTYREERNEDDCRVSVSSSKSTRFSVLTLFDVPVYEILHSWYSLLHPFVKLDGVGERDIRTKSLFIIKKVWGFFCLYTYLGSPSLLLYSLKESLKKDDYVTAPYIFQTQPFLQP